VYISLFRHSREGGNPDCFQRSCRGYTLVELLVAVAITAIASVALLRAFSVAGTVTARNEEMCYAKWLATSLKTEMDRLPTVDPNQTPAFGTEPGEWQSDRHTFDDIDDYAGWSGAPEDGNGQKNEDLVAYRLATEISYVSPDDFSTNVRPGQSNYVLCRINVFCLEKEVYHLQWLRTVRGDCYRP